MSATAAAAVAAPVVSLQSYLTPTATRIRTVGFRLIKLMTGLTGQVLSHADVEHLALTAAFEGFLELGGVPEAPESFDWPGHATSLEKRGLLWLKRETLGRQSEFGDVATRLSPRKTGAFVDTYRWSAWKHVTFSPHNQMPGTSHIGSELRSMACAERLEYLEPTAQDAAIDAPDLSAFLRDLASVLDAQSFQWLVERFRDGVSQTEQIARFIAATPSYQGEGGQKRAEDYINKKVSRARKRAAAVLGDRWAAVAREVTA